MTFIAPTRLDRGRGFFFASTRPPRTSSITCHRETASAPPRERVLMVDFSSPEGRTWWAVGAGDSLADALAFARDSCPSDTAWRATRWNDLYGD